MPDRELYDDDDDYNDWLPEYLRPSERDLRIAEIGKALDRALDKWNLSETPLSLARAWLGYEAFCIGFGAGLAQFPARTTTQTVAGIADLARTFVLADLYAFLKFGVGGSLRAPWGYSGALGISVFSPAAVKFWNLSELEDSYAQRNAIVAELRKISANKTAFLAKLPADISAQHDAQWQRIATLNASLDMSNRYQAGVATAELLCEWLTLLAVIATVFDAAIEVGLMAPRLVRLARSLTREGGATTTRAATGGAARAAATLAETRAPAAAMEPLPAPAPRPRGAEPKPPPVEPRPAADAGEVAPKVPPRRPVDTLKLSQVEYDLARQPGASPEQIVARRRVADSFYREYTNMPDEQIRSHVNAINFDKPVSVGPPPPAPPYQFQWRTPGTRGQYYGDFNSAPTSLGIRGAGEVPSGPVPKEYIQLRVPEDAPYLQSTSAPALDTWSAPSLAPEQTLGGDTQRFIPYQTASDMKEVGKVRAYAGPLR
jgi:Bacterial toxin 46